MALEVPGGSGIWLPLGGDWERATALEYLELLQQPTSPGNVRESAAVLVQGPFGSLSGFVMRGSTTASEDWPTGVKAHSPVAGKDTVVDIIVISLVIAFCLWLCASPEYCYWC